MWFYIIHSLKMEKTTVSKKIPYIFLYILGDSIGYLYQYFEVSFHPSNVSLKTEKLMDCTVIHKLKNTAISLNKF